MRLSPRVLAPPLVTVLLLTRAASATPPVAPAPPAPSSAPRADDFAHAPPRAPTDKVTLQLEDAELGELVRTIGELTGKRFVIASASLAKTKATVYAAQKVTVAEAYQAFLAVLAANKLTVVPQAGFYKIIESQDVARQLTPIERGDIPAEERYVTRIHRLQHLGAEDVANGVLSKLATKDASIVPYGPSNLLIISETGANLRRMLEILDTIDEAGEDDKLWLQPLRYVPSATVEKQLSEILDLKKRADAAGSAGAGGGSLHVGRIVALDHPNALVIVATRGSYQRILEVLERIDVAADGSTQVHVVMLQHADAKKVVGPINEAIGGPVAAAPAGGGSSAARGGSGTSAPAAVLEATAKVSADETTNSLIVTATARDFVPIKAVIDALDRPKRQVFIEAVVLDVSTTRGLDLGVAWHGGDVSSSIAGNGSQTTYGGFRPLSSALTPSTSELQAFALGVRGADLPFAGIPGISSIPSFGVFLSAVATSKAADILSTPHILASDNTPAEIKVQLNTSLQPNAPQTSILPTGGAVPNVGSTVANNYKPIGPKIKVTPHLNDSDEVRLDVDELISDIQTTPDKADTYGTISFVERTATTTLTVKDGETIVIGGLVRNRLSRSETKVPVLGDIPLLGALFRTRNDVTEKSNLVLVLTPYIIRDSNDLRRIFERKMQERQELMDRETIFAHDGWKPPRDWSRTRGLLADMRQASRTVDERRRGQEALGLPDANPKTVAQQPLELPVPQSPSSSAPASPASTPGAPKPTTTSTTSGGATLARPGIIER